MQASDKDFFKNIALNLSNLPQKTHKGKTKNKTRRRRKNKKNPKITLLNFFSIKSSSEADSNSSGLRLASEGAFDSVKFDKAGIKNLFPRKVKGDELRLLGKRSVDYKSETGNEEINHDSGKLSLGKLQSQNSTRIDFNHESDAVFGSSTKKRPSFGILGSLKKLKTKSEFERELDMMNSKSDVKDRRGELGDLGVLEKENLTLRRNVSSKKVSIKIDDKSNIIRASPLPNLNHKRQLSLKSLFNKNDDHDSLKAPSSSSEDNFCFLTPKNKIKKMSNQIPIPKPSIQFSKKNPSTQISPLFTKTSEEPKRLSTEMITKIIFRENKILSGDAQGDKDDKKSVSVLSFGEKDQQMEITSADSEISFGKDTAKSKFRSVSDNPIGEIEFDLSFQNSDILKKEIDRVREFGLDEVDIMKAHPGLNYFMRAKLTDWVREAASELGLRRETVHHSTTIIDLYLHRSRDFDKSQLQLLALASMLISSKIEEIHSPSTKNFSYMSNNAFSAADIQTMERRICKVLEWRLTFVTMNIVHGAMSEDWDFYLENLKVPKRTMKGAIIGMMKEKSFFFRARSKESYSLFCESTQVMDTIICYHKHRGFNRVKLMACILFLSINRRLFLETFEGEMTPETLKSSVEVYNLDLCDIFDEFLKNIDFALKLKNLENELKFVKEFFTLEFFYGIPIGMKLKGDHIKRESYEEFLSLQTHCKNSLGVVWFMMQRDEKKDTGHKETS